MGETTLAPPRRRRLLAVAAIAVLTLAAYANGLSGAFVVDDRSFLVDNPSLDFGRNVARFFGDGWGSFSNERFRDRSLYRPLSLVVLSLNRAVWGTWPVGYHLFNVVLHLANSLLVYRLLLVLRPRIGSWGCWAGAALFALHPVHVEAVTWISSLSHLLATFFLLVSLSLYLRFRETGSAVRAGAALAAYGCALLSLEIALTFPLFLLLLEALREKRLALRRVAPFLLLAVAYLGVRRLVFGTALPDKAVSPDAAANVMRFGVTYLRHVVAPWPQPLYLTSPGPGLADIAAILISLTTAGALVFTLVRRPRGSILVWAAAGWFAITLLPALAAARYEPAIFALRSLYLPSVAVAPLAAAGFAWLRESAPRPAGLVLAGTLLAGAALVSLANEGWRDEGAVYERALRTLPRDPDAHAGYAAYLGAKGHGGRAVEHWQEAIRHSQGTARAINLENLGTHFGKWGDYERAEHCFREARELAPDRAGPWLGLGNLAWHGGDRPEALECYKEAFARDPESYEACFNLALALRALGKTAEADRYQELADRMRAGR